LDRQRIVKISVTRSADLTGTIKKNRTGTLDHLSWLSVAH